MKKVVLVTFVLAMLFVGACGPSGSSEPSPEPSPEEQYAEAITELLPNIEIWKSNAIQFEQRINFEVFDSAEEDWDTIDDVFVWLDAGFLNVLPQAFWQEKTAPILTELSPDIAQITDDGFMIQAKLESLQPMAEVVSFHNEIIRCLKSVSNRAKAIEEILMNGDTLREIDPGACDNWHSSLTALETFAAEYNH